jgi:predicted alpha-1,2-mannosidase
MIKGARTPGVGLHGYQQRPDGEVFRQLGFVPVQAHAHSASHTLEYSSADFAIAQFAASQGDMASCATLMRSAQNWQHLFDPSVGWIRPRNADGRFSSDWSGTGEQAGFEEGSTWQYSWMVPHNYAGLIQAMGGNQSVIQKLDAFFSNLNGSATDPYYRPGNEPNFVAPYAYVFAGAPWKTQALIPRILASGFSATPNGLPGNDDLGAMSAVFFWGAVGLYPAIPGVGGWVIGTPMFSRVTFMLGNGRVLEIERSGSGTYVHGLKINGSEYRRSWLPISVLQENAVLEFVMGPAPRVDWASAPSDMPPSFRDSACARPATIRIGGPPPIPLAALGSSARSLGPH